MPDIWGVASLLVKLALYVGLTGSVGLVMIRIAYFDLTSPLHCYMRKQAVGLAGMSIVAAVLGFMLRGAALTGGIDGMMDPEMLGLLWTTSVGDVLIYRLVGAVVLMAGLYVSRFGLWVALGGGMLALWSFAQIGHVSEIPQTGVPLLLLLHLLGIAFWIGVLSPLRQLSLRPETLEGAAMLGHRFGQAASVIVPILIVAGLGMAWLLLGSLTALFATGYGQALLTKLALVGVVLVLAATNKLRFIPAMQAGDAKSARHLARSIEIETLVILSALAATATLTSVLTLPN